jgi:hypothetical protein
MVYGQTAKAYPTHKITNSAIFIAMSLSENLAYRFSNKVFGNESH